MYVSSSTSNIKQLYFYTYFPANKSMMQHCNKSISFVSCRCISITAALYFGCLYVYGLRLVFIWLIYKLVCALLSNFRPENLAK